MTKECMHSNACQVAALEEKCTTLVVSKINRRRSQKGKKPVPVSKVRAMVANPIWDPEAPLQSSDDEYVSFSDDDNDVDRRQARPIITQQRKRRLQDRARGLRNGVHEEMNEVVKSYTQTERMELAKVYKHEVGENVGEWLLRMWDGGADSVQLNAREALCMEQLTLHPQLMQVLRRVREIGGHFSLFDMVRHTIIVAFPSSNDIEPISPWSKPRDPITRIRVMGCVVGLNKDNWEGPDMEEFTASMRSRFLKSAPQEMKASLLSLLGSLGNNVKVHQVTTYLAEIGELESESNPRKGVFAASRTREEMVEPIEGEKQGKFRNKTRLRVNRFQMWNDLIEAGVPREQINGISTPAMFEKWLKLKKGSNKKVQVHLACKDQADNTMPSAPFVPKSPPPSYLKNTPLMPTDTAPLSIPLFQHCAPYAVPPPSLQAQDNTPPHSYPHMSSLFPTEYCARTYSHTTSSEKQALPESDGKVRSLYPVKDLMTHDLMDWDSAVVQ
ncbi:Hypothetical predicted protein [Pelobates cultripes]|uniref:Uncharacterized protein n=1 Tax=Pelobates cultripes TaxID=61616 RepID=A0AAD1VZM3_PELCU|nr:Hypothetical predicted protein [Pelobates cultripes]